jgi:hypothetical protein
MKPGALNIPRSDVSAWDNQTSSPPPCQYSVKLLCASWHENESGFSEVSLLLKCMEIPPNIGSYRQETC